MGGILKLIVFCLVLLLLYTLFKGFWTGDINSQTTVGEIARDVRFDAGNIVNTTKELAGDAGNGLMNDTGAEVRSEMQELKQELQ